jgi:hypothetical protein
MLPLLRVLNLTRLRDHPLQQLKKSLQRNVLNLASNLRRTRRFRSDLLGPNCAFHRARNVAFEIAEAALVMTADSRRTNQLTGRIGILTIQSVLKSAEIVFIPENGGGPSVRLKRTGPDVL